MAAWPLRTWGLVPVKGPDSAKSRLAGALAPRDRERLARALASRTFAVLSQARALAGWAVVSADPEVLAEAELCGGLAIPECRPDLNAALRQGAEEAARWGAQALVVVPADLPEMLPDDLDALVRDAPAPSGVMLVEGVRGGTNALWLAPPEAIPFSFGPGSFQRHREAALRAGVTVVIHRNPRLTFDLDTPADLARSAYATWSQGAARP